MTSMEDQLDKAFRGLDIDAIQNIEDDGKLRDSRDQEISLYDENPVSTDGDATDAVFSNHLLLQRIFTNLSLTDLKCCRQVNQTLQLEATKVLLRNFVTQQIQLHFSFDKYTASVLPRSSPEFKSKSTSKSGTDSTLTHKDSVESLVNLVALSKLFPSNNVSVCMRSQDNGTEGVQQIFWAHGEHIKELQLCIHHPTGEKCPSISLLHSILTQQLLNLEELCIIRIPQQWITEFPLIPEIKQEKSTQEFSKLKHLTYTGDLPKNILNHIFQLTPNLRSFTCDTTIPENLVVIIELNKVHLLKSCEFLFTPNRVDIYEALLQYSPKFEEIQGISHWNWENMIPVAVSKVSSIISNALYTSAPSLKTILKCPPLGFLTHFPRLPELLELELNYPHSFNNDSNKPMFPRHLSLAKTFPSLTSVIICPGKNQEFLRCRPEQIFPGREENDLYIPSVTLLRFEPTLQPNSYEIPPIWLTFFSSFFPNLITIKFPPFSDFLNAAKYVWKFTNLEDLEITIDLDSLGFPFPALDSAFTGFSMETCLALYYFPNDTDTSNLDELRLTPSILDLTRLRKLQINFYDSGHWENENYHLALSRLTGQYGFERNPHLKVFIVAKYLRVLDGLAEILPYVISFPEVLLA